MTLNRIPPKMLPQSYKTYTLLRPRDTHTRRAVCGEVECRAMANGWRTVVDVATELGAKQANYIRLHSGRSFTFTQTGTIVTFEFPPGQICFSEHRVQLERESLFRIRDGDWRGNPRETAVARVGQQAWLDNFGEQQEKLADQAKRG